MNQLRDIKIISERLRDPAELAAYLATRFAGLNLSAGDVVGLPALPVYAPGAASELLADEKSQSAPNIEQYLDQLRSLVLHLLHREYRRRVAGRSGLPFVELSRGLVPFTDTSHPRDVDVRQCHCANWVIAGERMCGFCGDPAPAGRPTRAWKVGAEIFQPLAPQHLNLPVANVAPSEVDPEDDEDRYDRAPEPEIDWEADNDRSI